jgi:Protein of unknown function (DUF4238)
MIYSQQAPKFDKRVHHVVPQAWQRRFFPMMAGGERATAGYYKDLTSGRVFGPVGPGIKMSEDYANIVFDEHFRPSDALEDELSVIESKAIPVLDRVVQSRSIGPNERIDLAALLALQALRYPQLFPRRLDLARFFAVALGEATRFPSVQDFNRWLEADGLRGAPLSQGDFQALVRSLTDTRAATIDALLQTHGYEAYFNPNLIVGAETVMRVAEHILALDWQLVEAARPSFVLSDTPMPTGDLRHSFCVGLSDRFGLRTAYPATPIGDDTVVVARPADVHEIAAINAGNPARRGSRTLKTTSTRT